MRVYVQIHWVENAADGKVKQKKRNVFFFTFWSVHNKIVFKSIRRAEKKQTIDSLSNSKTAMTTVMSITKTIFFAFVLTNFLFYFSQKNCLHFQYGWHSNILQDNCIYTKIGAKKNGSSSFRRGVWMSE